MQAGSERGFSMVEALAALLLVGLVATGIMAANNTLLRANSRNEIWAASIVAAEEAVEARRLEDPALMPKSGSQLTLAAVGAHDFSIVTTFCSETALCTDNARQLSIDVSYDGSPVYTIETVFTKIR